MSEGDILSDLIEGRISVQQAEQALDEILDSSLAADVQNQLGFSRAEWTAYAYGASLSELASWRQDGWPDRCIVCGNQIEIDRFGWIVIDVMGASRLKHISCPES
ncbi:hypothetical protein [Rhizobium sp. YTU87027]|uniref:hypothetical protein n=1 Tax=Rhizobium sp. YTU87027 TaxID=3417741 RepID=UPI003D69E1C3